MERYCEITNYKPSVITFYNREGQVLLREPSLLAVKLQDGIILALGEEARTVIEQIDERSANPDTGSDLRSKDVAVGSPLKNGAVADFDLAVKMFQFFLHKVNGRRWFRRPDIAVCIPENMTQVECRAMQELVISIGAKKVLIIEKPFSKAVREIPGNYKIILEISLESV